MKVSVVMRTYNRGYIIHEAIESVLNQTYPSFELIIVDNASTDDTADVVRRFADDRIRYIRHDENRGVSASGNTGIKAATGEIVAHLDSDDVWRPDMLDCMVSTLKENPEAGAAFCDVELFRGTTRIASLALSAPAFSKLLQSKKTMAGTSILFSRREMYLCLLEEVPIKPTSLLMRRSTLAKVGFYNEDWQSGEDWELYLRMAKEVRFAYLDRPLAIMRVMPDSTLAAFFEADKVCLRKMLLAELKTLRGDREAVRAAKRAIAKFENDLGFIHLKKGERGRSMLAYGRGFALTGDIRLLAKAACSILPWSLRQRLRGVGLSTAVVE